MGRKTVALQKRGKKTKNNNTPHQFDAGQTSMDRARTTDGVCNNANDSTTAQSQHLNGEPCDCFLRRGAMFLPEAYSATNIESSRSRHA